MKNTNFDNDLLNFNHTVEPPEVIRKLEEELDNQAKTKKINKVVSIATIIGAIASVIAALTGIVLIIMQLV